MSVLAPGSLLELWERAEPLTPVERAVALAAVVDPPTDEADVLSLPLGRRDARLLRLRSEWSRPILEAFVVCPSCGEKVEFALDADAILAQESIATTPEPVEIDGWVVCWRLPNSSDMIAAAAATDAVAAERTLIDRCVTSARAKDAPRSPRDAPPAVRAALAEAMASADPVAELVADLACPACDVSFAAEIDPTGFVWAELDDRARSLLIEIDMLARVYGWTEAEVLKLGERRRAAYLRMALGEAP